MLAIGTHVKVKDKETKHIGTIIMRSTSGWYTIEFSKPFRHNVYVQKNDIIVVSEEEWNIYNKGIITPNYAIEHVKNNRKSIEQQIDDIFESIGSDYSGIAGWCDAMTTSYQAYEEILNLAEDELEEKEAKHLNAKDHEELKQMYIELALATGDEEWFLELVKGDK